MVLPEFLDYLAGLLAIAGLRSRLLHRGVAEQPPVEVVDALDPEPAALGHRFEEGLEHSRELVRVAGARLDELLKEAPGKEADVLGEEAEQDAVEEVGGLPWLDAARP